MMPGYVVYGMVPGCTVSSCDNVTPGAAVSPQCPVESRISGMGYVYGSMGAVEGVVRFGAAAA